MNIGKCAGLLRRLCRYYCRFASVIFRCRYMYSAGIVNVLYLNPLFCGDTHKYKCEDKTQSHRQRQQRQCRSILYETPSVLQWTHLRAYELTKWSKPCSSRKPNQTRREEYLNVFEFDFVFKLNGIYWMNWIRFQFW